MLQNITHFLLKQKKQCAYNISFISCNMCGSGAVVSINSPMRTHIYIWGNSRPTAPLL